MEIEAVGADPEVGSGDRLDAIEPVLERRPVDVELQSSRSQVPASFEHDSRRGHEVQVGQLAQRLRSWMDIRNL